MQPGANKVRGRGKRVLHVCLPSILWAASLGHVVWVAGLSRACQWAVTHYCGSMGLMRSSNRMTKGCRETGTGRGGDGKRKTRRRRRTLTGGRGFVRLCRISDENEAVTD